MNPPQTEEACWENVKGWCIISEFNHKQWIDNGVL